MATKAKSKAKRPDFHSSKLTAKENAAVNDMIKTSWTNGRSSGRRSIYAQAKAMNAKTNANSLKIDHQASTSFRKRMNIPGAKWVEKRVYVGDYIRKTPVYVKVGRWYKPGDKHYDDVEAKFYNEPKGGSS